MKKKRCSNKLIITILIIILIILIVSIFLIAYYEKKIISRKPTRLNINTGAICPNGICEEGESCGNCHEDCGCSTNQYCDVTDWESGVRPTCKTHICGDGKLGPNEDCDEGANNGIICDPPYDGDCDYCDNDCNLIILQGDYCGDETVNGPEECDDGIDNGVVCDPPYEGECPYCDSDCTTVTLQGGICGDSIINGPEECDDSNIIDEDGCSSICITEYCGDGTLQEKLGEECDTGSENGDECTPDYGISCLYCSDICEDKTIEGAYCGDGNCDSGDEDCNICSSDCGSCSISNEDTESVVQDTGTSRPHVCGDGFVEFGEECDDGNTLSGDGCSSRCITEYCGDGTLQEKLGEECDNGVDNGQECYLDNQTECNYCQNNCKIIQLRKAEETSPPQPTQQPQSPVIITTRTLIYLFIILLIIILILFILFKRRKKKKEVKPIKKKSKRKK